MAKQASQSSILQRLEKSLGKIHEEVKKTEATARGRMLMPGLRNALGQVDSVQLVAETGKTPRFTIAGVCLRDSVESDSKVNEGIRWNVTHFLGNFRDGTTAEDVMIRLYSDLKLLGVDVEGSESLTETLKKAEGLNKEKPLVLFNTTSRTNKDGYPYTNIQGLYSGEEDVEEEPIIQEEPTEEEEDSSASPYEEGDSVSVEYDGETWDGVVQGINTTQQSCLIAFEEDESEDWVDWPEIQPR